MCFRGFDGDRDPVWHPFPAHGIVARRFQAGDPFAAAPMSPPVGILDMSLRVPAILPFPSQRHGNPKVGCTVTMYVCICPTLIHLGQRPNFTNEAMPRPRKCDSVPRRTRVLSYHDVTKYSVRQQASSMASWVEAIVSRSGESILSFVDQLQQS
jgi:hypothetical protein